MLTDWVGSEVLMSFSRRSYDGMAQAAKQTRCCALQEDSNKVIRYIHHQSAAKQISSTHIRQVIKLYSHSDLESGLQVLAINPEILVRV